MMEELKDDISRWYYDDGIISSEASTSPTIR